MEGKWPQTWAGMRTQGSRGFSEFVIPLKGFGAGTRGEGAEFGIRNLFLWWAENGAGSGNTAGEGLASGRGHRRSKSR